MDRPRGQSPDNMDKRRHGLPDRTLRTTREGAEHTALPLSASALCALGSAVAFEIPTKKRTKALFSYGPPNVRT